MSLAHRGVLFLDEFLEFPRAVLDGLRQPLEDGRVVIARARSAVVYPARFTLVAATNPCPCGRAGDPRAHCTCPESAVVRYRSRLSGPLADRIDVHVTVGAVPLRALAARAPEVTSRRECVSGSQRARARQLHRFASGAGGLGVTCNAHASGRWLESHSAHHDGGPRPPP